MTRLSEEAVVLCFQLTLRRISEPRSARLGRLLALHSVSRTRVKLALRVV